MIAIAAMARNRVIGAEGKIPWHLSEDMKFFKRTTLGHILVVGRKTFESFGKPLPGREHWVITRGVEIPGVRTFRDPRDVPTTDPDRQVFLAGGAEIYRALLPACTELLLTHVDRTVDGDTIFPPFEDDFSEDGVVFEAPEMVVRRYVRRGK
jgi:dihydrofolate reductase